MLSHITISNYALIKSLDLAVADGFTVITGETGAGKSILLGALGLVLGNRADRNILADEGAKCVVEATFSINNLNANCPVSMTHFIFLRWICLKKR